MEGKSKEPKDDSSTSEIPASTSNEEDKKVEQELVNVNDSIAKKRHTISKILNQAGAHRKLLALNEKVQARRKTEPRIQKSDDEPEIPEEEGPIVRERRKTEPKVVPQAESRRKSKVKVEDDPRRGSKSIKSKPAATKSSSRLQGSESRNVLDLYKTKTGSKKQVRIEAKSSFEEATTAEGENEDGPMLNVSSSTQKFRKSAIEHQIRDEIFGYLSKLSLPQHLIYTRDNIQTDFESESEITEQDDERDMTWLFQMSETEENPKPSVDDTTDEIRIEKSQSLLLFWIFLLIGGRMPFNFERSSDSVTAQAKLQIKKTTRRYWAFLISTIILTFSSVISIINLFLIVAEEEVKGDPHIQIEKLLLGKHEVSALVFVTSLALASICSINVLIDGDAITEFMTLCGKTLDEFRFKSTSGVLVIILIYIVWTISLFIFEVILFSLTNSDPNPNPFMEGIHLLIAIVFRSFVPNVLIETNEAKGNESEIQSSSQLWKYGTFIVCLNGYALYCARNFVVMVVVCSIGIRNLAMEWNFRLRLALRQVNVKKKELYLQNLKQSLTYQKMFEWHRKIVELVDQNSKVFGTILLTFYLTLAFVFAGQLIELAIALVGRDELTFRLNETVKIYEFEKNTGHFMWLCFHMSQTIGFFLFVSLFLADTGHEVMNGVRHIVRHNYMSVVSAHQKKFVLSLSMSFSAKKPHLLGARGVFDIDRHFIIGFFAFLMYFFSVMIQTRHPKLLTLPIVVQCPPNSDRFCVHGIDVTDSQVPDLNNKNAAAAEKMRLLHPNNSTQPQPSTRPPTTLPAPFDVCNFTAGQGIYWAQVGWKLTVQMPTVCDSVGEVEPYPDGCKKRVITGVKKPFEFLSDSYHIVECGNPKNKILNQWRDDCFNVPLFKVNSTEVAIAKAVKVPSATWYYVMCCYDYGYTNGQLRFCNQNTTSSLYELCGIKHDASSFKHPFRIQHVDPALHECIDMDDPNSTDPKCDRVHKCFCGETRNYIIPTTPSGLITCPP